MLKELHNDLKQGAIPNEKEIKNIQQLIIKITL